MKEVPTVVAGMKLDLWKDETEELVTKSELGNLVKVTKASEYRLCSAYTGEGIDELFTFAIKQLFQIDIS